MAWYDAIGIGRKRAAALDLIDYPFASPWTEGSLETILLADMMGLEDVNLPMTRALAITIPAVAKARNLLVSQIAPLELVALDGHSKTPQTVQPTWTYRTDSPVTPYERMAWTVDDLIFYGCSLWRRTNGAVQDNRTTLLSTNRVPQSRWRVADDGGIELDVDGSGDFKAVDETDVILFNSPYEGLLVIGSRTMRGAIDMERAWVGRARNPVPLIELHRLDDTSMTDDEAQQYADAWAKARTQEAGAIGVTPSSIEIRTHGDVKADLMLEGRNAIRTDIGSLLNLRASALDGTTGVDSLTYTTTQGERNAFFDIDLPFWQNPIEARLSMDDVVPRGQIVRFDRSTPKSAVKYRAKQ